MSSSSDQDLGVLSSQLGSRIQETACLPLHAGPGACAGGLQPPAEQAGAAGHHARLPGGGNSFPSPRLLSVVSVCGLLVLLDTVQGSLEVELVL